MSFPGKDKDKAPATQALGLRREERIDVALPVLFEGGGSGLTRNVSASGIYVETEDQIRLGTPIKLTIDFEGQPGGLLRVTCDASILRIEEKQGRRGIAAAIQWSAH